MMQQETDEARIRRKAHELWEADGRPHGRDQDHWDQAREIIAIQDSQAGTLLPRDSGAEEPIEDGEASLRNLADFPNLTDQGENLLTSTDREPSFESDGSNSMPSIEVPTSDQPGIRSGSAVKSEAKPAAARKTPSKPAQPVAAAPAAKPASGPKAVSSEPAKSATPPKKAPAKK